MKVFVYGTLKKNGFLHDAYLEDAKFIKSDYVNGDLYKLYGLPCLVFDKKSKNKVPGEVYNVDEEMFNLIKGMEEHAGYKTISVVTVGGEKVKVFTSGGYLLSSLEAKYVEHEKIKSW